MTSRRRAALFACSFVRKALVAGDFVPGGFVAGAF
jgi:hypothetical protein